METSVLELQKFGFQLYMWDLPCNAECERKTSIGEVAMHVVDESLWSFSGTSAQSSEIAV